MNPNSTAGQKIVDGFLYAFGAVFGWEIGLAIYNAIVGLVHRV